MRCSQDWTACRLSLDHATVSFHCDSLGHCYGRTRINLDRAVGEPPPPHIVLMINKGLLDWKYSL